MKNIKNLILVAMLFIASCGGNDPSIVTPPIFTDPTTKLAVLAESSFTQELMSEASAMEPLVTTSGAQIHMGYWSAAGNHGSLVRVLDSINATSATATPPQRAIWDEGSTSSIQYPAYVTMNNEFWYERSSFVNGTGTIRGITYTDQHPVTMDNANDIWGGYSQRYADMATTIQTATGNKVKVWCFVNGAKINRVFFKYEFPELQALEAAGIVQVFFAKTIDSDWTIPDNWNEGTQNAPTPLPANIAATPSVSKGPVYSAKIEENIAYDIADAYLDGQFGLGATARETALKEFERRNPGFTEATYEDAFSKAVVLAAF